MLARVFDPFFTTKPRGKGTGLGLSQVIGIAKQSGGTATVSSAEGVGTSVTIWLPRVPAPSVDIVDNANVAVPARAEGRVLVIDDDDGVRRFIVDSLELLGYVVTAASSGEEGLDQIARERPDLVIVDFAMNGIDGAEVAAKAVALLPGLPVILATGYAEIADIDQLKTVTAILRKPFKVDALADALRNALRRTDKT